MCVQLAGHVVFLFCQSQTIPEQQNERHGKMAGATASTVKETVGSNITQSTQFTILHPPNTTVKQ